MVFWKAALPFQKTFFFFSQKTKDTVQFWSSIASLQEENERLLKENSRLYRELGMSKETERENENLRRQLNLLPRSRFELENSFVIGRSQKGTGDWIMIDKGKSSGLEVGMPAIVDEGVLVGKVSEVFFDSARVRMISDPESLINIVDAESGARGIVRGEYGLGIFLDMVEQGEAISVGDILMTSGLGGEFPENLLVGKISQIKSSKDKLFQQALVVPTVESAKLEAVSIIKKTIRN